MKLGIIGGAGLLGATTAFFAGSKNILDEIKLVDLNENMAMSHAMDMGQALQGISRTKVSKAGYPDLGDCDIILITASLPERNVANRNEYLEGNLGVVTPICQSLKTCCKKEAIVINATNPVDVFNYVVYRQLGWDRRKMIGFSANDTLRLKWATNLVTGREIGRLDALCVGEHGDGQVRLYDQMRYDGEPLVLTEEEKKQIEEKTANWFTEYQALRSGRTSGWTSAVSLTSIIEAIAGDTRAVIPCSAVLEGEMGYEGISMGMPVCLGKEGIAEIKDPGFTDKQKLQLDKTGEKIKGLLQGIGY